MKGRGWNAQAATAASLEARAYDWRPEPAPSAPRTRWITTSLSVQRAEPSLPRVRFLEAPPDRFARIDAHITARLRALRMENA